MISGKGRIAAAFTFAALVTIAASPKTRETSAVRPDTPLEEREIVERRLLLLRLDPKRGAPPGACDALSAADLVITVGGVAATVSAVERVPRPERHWLLLDVSESAEGRRAEVKRSAQQYVREVMTPGVDAAALVAIDDDAILYAGPTTDPAALAARIGEIPAGRMSALRDGLDTVLRQVTGDRGEHLILYWTDGQDTESVGTTEDLLETLDRTPNATIFPIALRPTHDTPGRPLMDAFMFEVARRSGGEGFASSDPRWLERVRGWISRRFSVSFALPDETPQGPLRVSVRSKRCEATILRDPFARPDAIAGAAPPAPRSWVRLHARNRRGDDAACSGDPAAASWERPWRAESDALEGCMLDVIRARGRFAARDVRVLAPGIAALPGSIDEAIERLALPESASSPLLVEGSALLAQRARLAGSLFAARADYREFALARLARFAEDDVRAIERDLSRASPELPPEQIAEIARASRAGRRALEAVQTPTDADLARVLAAWLGDVPASTVFRDWERRLIDARIASGRDPSAAAKWKAVRVRLGRTDGVGVVAPLILLKDPARDLIGFRRIVIRQSPDGSDGTERRIPERPLALELVDRLASSTAIRDRLAGGGYRATRIDEEPIEPAWRAGLGDPFRRAHVTVVLEARARAARAVLDAEVRVDDGGLTLVRFAPSATGDADLAALFRSMRPE